MARRDAFVMMPVEHAKAWYKLRYWDRALGADLFRVFGNDELLDVALADLPDVACRMLAVDGRDRATVRRALARIIEEGLIFEEGNSTRLMYSREAFKKHHQSAHERSATGQQTVSDSSGNGRGMVSEPSVTGQQTVGERSVNEPRLDRDVSVNGKGKRPNVAESNNTYIPDKKDKIRKIREENARAQPFWADLGHQSLGQWLTVEIKREHTRRNGTGQPPAMGKSWGTAVATLAEWLSEASDPRATVAKLLDGFFADSRAEAAGFPIAWLGNNPTQYLVTAKPKAMQAPGPDEYNADFRELLGDDPYMRDAAGGTQ